MKAPDLPLCVQRVAWLSSSALGLCCQLVESNILSWQEPGLFGGFHGTSLTNSSIECNPVPVVEPVFGNKRWLTGIPSNYLEISLGSLSYNLPYFFICMMQMNFIRITYKVLEEGSFLEAQSPYLCIHHWGNMPLPPPETIDFFSYSGRGWPHIPSSPSPMTRYWQARSCAGLVPAITTTMWSRVQKHYHVSREAK